MTRWIAILTVSAALGLAQAPAPLVTPKAGFALSKLMYANIELTVYLVSGLAQPQAGAASDLPDDLAPTLNQMRGVFAYKTYKLISAFTLRGRNNGGAESAGELPLNNWIYDFKYRSAEVQESTPGVVHINRLWLEIAKRGGPLARSAAPAAGGGRFEAPSAIALSPNTVVLVSTDLDLKEGQKTVVGQSAVNGTDALFLVIVPKVIE